ncbi:MAG: hypothetical protein AAGI07_16650 [Bacteroidota bacterium]
MHMKARQNIPQQLKDETLTEYRYFNHKIPDLSIIPFYHLPGIYKVNKSASKLKKRSTVVPV